LARLAALRRENVFPVLLEPGHPAEREVVHDNIPGDNHVSSLINTIFQQYINYLWKKELRCPVPWTEVFKEKKTKASPRFLTVYFFEQCT